MTSCKHSVCTTGDLVEAAQRAVGEADCLGSAVAWIHDGIKVMVRFGFSVPKALVAYYDAKWTLEASADRGIRHAQNRGQAIKWKMGSVMVRVEPDDTIRKLMSAYIDLRTS